MAEVLNLFRESVLFRRSATDGIHKSDVFVDRHDQTLLKFFDKFTHLKLLQKSILDVKFFIYFDVNF